MFKFRRSSLCSNPEVMSNNSSSEDEQQKPSKGTLLRNSVSESRLLAFTCNNSSPPDEKESLSTPSSLDSPDRESVDNLDPNGVEEPTAARNMDGIFEKCKVGVKKDSSASAPLAIAMCDRKRKERHESSSQEQEKKVIRANDPEPVEATTTAASNRTQETLAGKAGVEKCQNQFTTEVTSAVNSDDILKSVPPSNSAPQIGYGLRNIPMDFEPEIQRQWERTQAQWNSRKTRRPHRSFPAGKSKTEIDGSVSRTHHHRERPQSCNPNIELESQGGKKEQTSVAAAEIESLSELESEDLGQDPFDDESEIPKKPVNLAPLPLLDLSTLHQNIDSMEPISACRLSCSSDHAMLSPRNHTLIREMAGIPHIPQHQSPVHPASANHQTEDTTKDSRVNGLLKQIANLKKHARELEYEFEQINGHKPSQMDKQNNKEMRKCLLQITRVKRELQMIREDYTNQTESAANILNTKRLRVPSSSSFTARIRTVSDEALKQLQALVGQVQNALDESRKACGRPEDPMFMTQQELVSEKNSMQKQLLVLERRHGRPDTKEEKEIVKALYSRYRLVKKLCFRHSSERENSFDLVPIIEHETLDLSNSSRRGSLEKDSKDASDGNSQKENCPSTSAEVIDLKNEDFNDMSLPELESKHKLASEEKKRLRGILRKFEMEFQNSTGRAPLKEDKYSTSDMELLYQKYKHFRANTKLLDVLIAKKKYPFSVAELGKVED